MSSTGERASGRKSRREERKEETRGELIDAAAKVFARRGFHGAALDQIAAEAGYSTGAIYWHFSGKDDLFLAVYENYAETRAREWAKVRTDTKGTAAQVARAYADQWMSRLRRDPDFMVLTLEFVVHVWRNPALRERFGPRAAYGRHVLAEIIEEDTRRRGLELPMPAEDLATILRELGSGLGLAKLADPDAFRDDVFGDFVESFFRLLEDTARQEVPDPSPSRERRPQPTASGAAEAVGAGGSHDLP